MVRPGFLEMPLTSRSVHARQSGRPSAQFPAISPLWDVDLAVAAVPELAVFGDLQLCGVGGGDAVARLQAVAFLQLRQGAHQAGVGRVQRRDALLLHAHKNTRTQTSVVTDIVITRAKCFPFSGTEFEQFCEQKKKAIIANMWTKQQTCVDASSSEQSGTQLEDFP